MSRTMYGYEARVHAGWNDNDRHRCSARCVWSAEAAGQQGEVELEGRGSRGSY